MHLTQKKKIIFVGSFKPTSKDGSIGGQMFACNLLVNSEISDIVNWTLLDTTSVTNKKRLFITRLNGALIRLIKFCFFLLKEKHDSVLIFTSDGWSFYEKGFMCIIAKKIFKCNVILAPRSGLVLSNLSRSSLISSYITSIFQLVDIVICQSAYWRNLFFFHSGQFNSSKFVIIENALEIQKYVSLKVETKSHKETIVILFLAWVTKNKGIYDLIEAVLLLHRDKINFTLLIAGNGNDFKPVYDLISNSEIRSNVKFLGWVSGGDKLKLLEKSDIFVLPTYFEGYPNSLIEAMASGKACVATRVGSIPDIITNLENGLLYDSKNVNQLYACLKLLIQNPVLRQSLSTKARHQVESINSKNIIVEKWKKIVLNVE